MKEQDNCKTVDPFQGGVTLELNESMVLHVKKGGSLGFGGVTPICGGSP